MADRHRFARKRTFYDEFPDYTRPVLELPPERKERMLGRLRSLYGDQAAQKWMPELERILKVHHACKPPEMIAKEKRYAPGERFSEEDIILITYGDNVRSRRRSPLSALHQFVKTYLRGAVNTLHILPFFPYSSDRGFAVIDYRRVDPRLGTWDDIRDKKRRYDLMFDAVLNHCSSRSEMFQEFLNGNPAYRDSFIAYDSPGDLTPDQRRKIFRPRTSDILTRFETIDGTKYVWTTFSPDQIDLNFRNPAVLMQVVDSVLFYIRHGADILRLDAVTYLWAEPGTESVHLPQTHEIVKLLRDVVDTVASGVALVTETNVPHKDNLSYFGDGLDEAHMVYNFALPPMVLHAFYRGDASRLSRWARDMATPSGLTAFLNILDTHDGIGLMGVRGLLPDEEIRFVVETARTRGALVSFKTTGEGAEEPYEINSTWWSAVNPGQSAENLDIQVRRHIASRSIALELRGVPGIYFHGALGTVSDRRAAEISGVNRDVNRSLIDPREVAQALKDPDSKTSRLFRCGNAQLQARRQERAFHPRGGQRILDLSPRAFSVFRTSPEGDRHILCVTNVTGEAVNLNVSPADLGVRQERWKDLLSGRRWAARGGRLSLRIEPYGVCWLKPAGEIAQDGPAPCPSG